MNPLLLFLIGIKIVFILILLRKLYKDPNREQINWAKFRAGMFRLTDPVSWLKTLSGWFNIRNIIIAGLLFGAIWGHGWYRGRMGAPVKIDIGYGKEAIISLNDSFLKIEKDGSVYVEDKQGNRIKQITVKDIPQLKRKLSPIGFQLDPIFVAGGSVGESGMGWEVGAGISWFRYFRANLDSFLTTRGIYPIGISYRITDNSGAGLGGGLGYKGDRRIMLYYKFKF